MDTRNRIKALFLKWGKDGWYFPTCLARRDDVLYSKVPIDDIMFACDELVDLGFLEFQPAPKTADVKYMQYYNENNGKKYRLIEIPY